jgi:cytidylate kinase
MYRAVALAGMRSGVDWDRPEALSQLARQLKIELSGERILLDGEDVTEAVRSAEVTALTRFAADNPAVRERLVDLQRLAAEGGDLVTEGRDQGTVVFPDAKWKIFLTASAEERARRRLGELAKRGESVPLEKVLADISRRDRQDEQRAVGPLARAADAITVATDGMTIEEVVKQIELMIRA